MTTSRTFDLYDRILFDKRRYAFFYHWANDLWGPEPVRWDETLAIFRDLAVRSFKALHKDRIAGVGISNSGELSIGGSTVVLNRHDKMVPLSSMTGKARRKHRIWWNRLLRSKGSKRYPNMISKGKPNGQYIESF